MRKCTIAFLFLAATCLADSVDSPEMLLIRHGTIIDGTGAAGFQGDVLLVGDRIARVGDIDPSAFPQARLIDATGKVVTPGFIDAHSHAAPFGPNRCENFLAMGVTTVCLGQDGESPDDLSKWMQRVESEGSPVNVAMFVGHGTVRNLADVGLQTGPSSEQITAMQQLVRDAMDEGCFGLTTGLEYLPGRYADLNELAALAEPVARAGGMVMSHMRSEDDEKIAGALAELLNQGRPSGCPVHVSHIKVTYGHGASRAEALLRQMQTAREAGLRVTADIYPYVASYTGIGIVFPDWAKPPNDYAEVARTRREELADYLRRRVTQRNGPEATLFGTAPWAGKTLAQVAAELGKPFEDVLIDDIGPDGAHAAYFVMDAQLQERLLIDPHIMISSDGSATSHHPRGHGAFARVIRKYVVEKHLLTLEQAIHKMTGLPADTIGMERIQRGRIAEGWFADLLVFDPQAVRDNATYEQPHRVASGLDCVIVNGKLVRENDKSTGQTAGRILRRAGTAMHAEVKRLLKDYDGSDRPGATVALIHHGRPLLVDAFGLANLESKTPAAPETNYRLASVTKQFTAMCIAMLAECGKLGYGDPIRRFLPELPAIGDHMTIRHLIGHTSGLIDYEDLIPPGQKEQLKDADVLKLLEDQQGTYFTPGTQYRYSNSGYALLALIVERASGVDFAGFLCDNIFRPLGMNDTVAFEEGVSTVPHRALGYRQKDSEYAESDQSVTSAVLGDGGIYTSVLDYARWDEALYHERLVSRPTLERIFTTGIVVDGTPTGYGFGWRLDQRHGYRVVHHNGETCGFNTAVRRIPDEQLTVVLLTNRAGDQAGRIADQLLDWILVESDLLPRVPELPAVDPQQVEWQWRDAAELRIEGKGWNDTERMYERLPARAAGKVPPMVWDLSKHTSGICVRFMTDSPRIAATWDGGGAMNHMAATGNSGLDLYRRQGGRWTFCGVGRPQTTTTTATLAGYLPQEPTEYLLYLPLYHSLTELRIGVEPGASLEPAPPRESRPIVFYGTSITQGGCASRAGMSHPAILGRHLDREIINLGFSGSGKMEPIMAELVGELDPALFVLECLPNMTPDMVRERVAPFVHHLRHAHPATPILLVENPIHPLHNTGNEILHTVFEQLCAEGLERIYYLAGEHLLEGDEEGTVDGVHPTDLGFMRMAQAYEPAVLDALAVNAPAE